MMSKTFLFTSRSVPKILLIPILLLLIVLIPILILMAIPMLVFGRHLLSRALKKLQGTPGQEKPSPKQVRSSDPSEIIIEAEHRRIN